jgi:23S rRNA pseudouridine1911/1915/1917 synthase
MTEQLSAELPPELAGMRLDAALARVLTAYSRSQLKQWLQEGALTVDGGQPLPRSVVRGGEQVRLRVPDTPASEARPEPILLHVVHADEATIVIDKPAGLVVHPAAGHREGTLVNALLHYAPELAALPRAGIVHRLDKETTGLLVVARTAAAQTALVRQLQERSVHREYRALVQGVLISGGTVDAAIGRHPVDRKRMAVVSGGKPAITHYRVLQRLRAPSLLQVQLHPAGGYSLALQGPERQASAQLLKQRLPGLQPFLAIAAHELARLGHPQASFAVQLHDEDPKEPCFRFDAPLQADGHLARLQHRHPRAAGGVGHRAKGRLDYTRVPREPRVDGPHVAQMDHGDNGQRACGQQ